MASKDAFDLRIREMDRAEHTEFKLGEKFGYLCDDGVLIECEIIRLHSTQKKAFCHLGIDHKHLCENHNTWIEFPCDRICNTSTIPTIKSKFPIINPPINCASAQIGNNASKKRSKPFCNKNKKKTYKIYDLENDEEMKLFAGSLVENTFALIKIPNQYKSSLNDFFDIFNKLYSSNKHSFECENYGQYIGYTSTKYIKQSLWLYLDYDNKSLFPPLKNKKKSILNDKEIELKVLNAYQLYNNIGDKIIHSVLKDQCKDHKSYVECYNNLYPQNKNNIEMKSNVNYSECAVYHKFRKSMNLSLNNVAIIQYYGEKNKKRKKSIFDINGFLNKKKNSKQQSMESKEENPSLPCEEHIDYSLVTLLMANEPGIQVRNIMNFEWIDVDEIILKNNMDRRDVLIVMTGLTLSTLLHHRIACYHSVKRSFKNDRLSIPLFVYADPNGYLDTSLIKPNSGFIITTNSQKINISQYLSTNMHPSVNFHNV